jgi:hypothetical protein
VNLGSSARDGEIEALVVDRYLDSLLAREPRDEGAVPADLRETADLLASELPRYHPSFRFVEALGARLAASAIDREPGRLLTFPAVAADVRPGQVHPVVLGGVLTSAAISLAGAAWVAWRRGGRPSTDPMARAMRAVARARIV